jgi:hypothetical protein
MMVRPGRFMGPVGGGAAGDFATSFDGSNDYYQWASTPTGLVDGPNLTVSAWVSSVPDLATEQDIVDFGAGTETRIRAVSNNLGVVIRSIVPASVGFGGSNGPSLVDGAVHHIIYSVSQSGASDWRKLVIDGVTITDTTALSADNLNLATGALSLGARQGGPNSFFGGTMFAVWIDNSAHDVVADITTWRNVDGTPADLGADGSAPGSQPLIYLPDGDATNNLGTGGNAAAFGSPTRVPRPS